MKSLSAKTFQCGVTVQGLTTLSGTVYLTALTNTATWDYVVVGTTAQGQLYTRTYAQLMSDITSGIGLSGYVPTSRTLTINGVSYDLTANRSWTISTVDYTSRLQHVVKAGVAINKGQAVYVTSADGTNMIVGLASNASEATSSKTMGLLDATVSTNGFANVVTEGLLDGLDTSTAGAAGDPVWLGTGGNLIYGLANKPYAPAHLVFIGIVTRKNSNNGEIFVKVQNGFELNEIHDVDLKTNLPVNGELLGFNGTLWVNKTIAGWLGYTPANASGTTNYISKFTGSTTLGNSQIFDNGTNVGIGTTTMYGKLSISSGNSNGIRIDTNGGGYSALNIGGTGSLTVDAPGITGGRFQITDSGNVGIGTPSPSHNLHIYGAGDRLIKIENIGTYLMYVGLISNEGYIGSTNATPLGFYTNGVNRIYINTSGNVGIGTTTPSQKLDVNGYAKFTSGIILDGGATSHYREFIWNTSGFNRWDLYVHGAEPGSNVGGDLFLARYADNGAYLANAVTFQRSTGNVGIGTTSPNYKLQVAGGDIAIDYNRYLRGGAGGDWNLVNLYNGGTGDIEITMLNANWYLRHNANATFAGKIGIGTTNPVSKLHVLLNGNTSGGPTGNVASFQNSSAGNNAYISLFGAYNAEAGIIFTDESEQYKGKIGYDNISEYMYFQTDGSEKVRITAAGNVGIGTTNPATQLTLNKVAGNAMLQLINASESAFSLKTYNSGSGTVQGSVFMQYLDYSSTINGYMAYHRGGGGSDGFLSFGDNGGERVRFANGGNVGIGVTNPSYKLDVNGSFNAVTSGVYLTYNSGIIYHGSSYYQFPSGSYYLLYGRTGMGLIFGSNNAEVGRFDLSGNLGIGTTAPAEKLHVTQNIALGLTGGSIGDTNNILFPTVNGGTHAGVPNGIYYTKKGNWGGQIDIRTSYDWGYSTDNAKISLNGAEGNGITFSTGASALGSTERVRITSDGNVGIGTTSPQSILEVRSAGVGNAGAVITLNRVGNWASSYCGLKLNTNDAGTDWWNVGMLATTTNTFNIGQNGGAMMSILTNGNIGIGTTTPVSPLDVNGIISSRGIFIAQNSGTYNIIYNASNSVAMYLGGSGDQNNYYDNNSHFFRNAGGGTTFGRWTSTGLGIGTTSPTTPLHVMGIVQVEGGGSTTFYGTDASGSYARNFGTQLYTFRDAGGSIITSINTTSGVITTTGGNSTNWNTAYGWGNHSSAGYVPQARTLTINGTSYDLSANRSWTIATTTPGGSDTQFQYNSSGSLAGASALTYNSTTNRVGINQASPGYDFDVNGQVRVQDKLRVGTVNSGNGVVHMSSSATINPSATTIVWAQNVSVGMCAFIEYYILNSNSLTDQRAGTIMVTWNQSGTPTIAHTETTTPDIGSTIAVNFTSSLVGSDARINAVNSSANPYTIVMSYKYF